MEPSPFGISALIGSVWKFCVGMYGVTYLLVMHFLVFAFLYFNVVCFMSVIVLARDGNPLRTGAVGPFLVLCLVLVLCYVYAWFVVPAREGCAAFRVVYMLFVTNYVWKWIMTMEFEFVCLTSDSLTTFAFHWPFCILLYYFIKHWSCQYNMYEHLLHKRTLNIPYCIL